MFIFKLAGHLGRPVAEILQLSSYELTYWMAFDLIHPLPDHTWNAGLVASTMWNSQVLKARTHPEDFYGIGRTYRDKLDRERREAEVRRGKAQARAAEMNAQIAAVRRGMPVDEALALGKVNGRSPR